jgi:phage gp36-like protein
MAYAQQPDLITVGFNANVQGTLTLGQINAALQNASDFADGFFRARYGAGSCPVLAWDSSVIEAVAKIAAYRLIVIRGYNPNNSGDVNFRLQFDDAVRWLGMVQRQQAHPNVTPATTSGNGAVQPQVISKSVVNVSNGGTAPNRGW